VALGSPVSVAEAGEAAGLAVTVAVTVGAGEEVVPESPQPAAATAATMRISKRRAGTVAVEAGPFRPADESICRSFRALTARQAAQ
jgi:hypothetical protein